MCRVDAADVEYTSLKPRLKSIEDRTGLGESAAFLVWFLENVYRLDNTEARDAVCDHANDKGIDGIYIDHNNEEIHFLQSKIRQSANGTIGDVGPKNLVASVQQFDDASKIDAILGGNADAELKQLLIRSQLADMVKNGYALVAVYVTNEKHDVDSTAYAAITSSIRIFDRSAIANHVIDLDASDAQKPEFTFDTSYVEPMILQSGSGATAASMYMFPAQALQLVHMDGIADGSLFRANVRYTLGNTTVNKSILKSISDKSTHAEFILFHNGIIILCSEVDTSIPDRLTVRNYSVVNGAQSLTSFHSAKSKLSSDLRVIVKVVVVQDEDLAKTITHNSNNQNAIRPRDLRSNHAIMLRLQKEMEGDSGNYFFEIKRGEASPPGSTVITNDEIGRALLAFDLREPWVAHQVYKVFDEKYADIFGRPEVNSVRVIFLHHLLGVVDQVLPKLQNKPMGAYSLTRYFLLYLLSQILRAHPSSKKYVVDPAQLGARMPEFLDKCGEILKTVIVDLAYEARSPDFDYKSILKSPVQSSDLAARILASYEKDVARDKAESFNDWEAP